MAWTAATQWEIRPDGALSNGVGFDPALGGTDYSQQAAPQLTVTDAVGNSTTTVTSVTGGFTAAMVGNGLNVNGNLYQITAVTNSNTVTVDRVTATFSGQTARVGGAGGAKGTVTSAWEPWEFAVIVPGNVIWLRNTNSAGTPTSYTTTAGINTSTGSVQFNYVRVEGYATVRGDGGIAQFPSAPANWSSGTYVLLKNLSVGGTFGGATLFAGAAGQIVENCIFDASTHASTYNVQDGGSVLFRRCWFKAPPSGTGANLRITGAGTGGGSKYEYCHLDGVAGVLNVSIEAAVSPTFYGCILNNGTFCLQFNNINAGAYLKHCIVWGADNTGLALNNDNNDQNTLVEQNIFGANGVYDIAQTNDKTGLAGVQSWVNAAFRCNFFFTTGTARYHFQPAAADDVTLTVNPFVNAGAGNFGLNSTTGGGALVTSTACTSTFPDGVNKAVEISGINQSAAAASLTAAAASMRSIWREYTNERNTTVIPDSTVDLYLDAGLQALNRRVRYHLSDSTTGITLVAGQQEYTLPADCVWVVWVEWNGREIQKAAIDEWRRRGIDWRAAKAGTPSEWAMYRDRLILYPPPDAAAVAAQANPFVRYVSAPPSISTNGPEQLNNQDLRVPVLLAVAEWAAAHPDSALATLRNQSFLSRFEQEAERIGIDYLARQVAR